MEDALSARAGKKDFVPIHRDFKDHKGATEGDVSAEDIEKAVQEFKDKHNRDPTEKELSDLMEAKETPRGTPTEAEMIRIEDILRT